MRSINSFLTTVTLLFLASLALGILTSSHTLGSQYEALSNSASSRLDSQIASTTTSIPIKERSLTLSNSQLETTGLSQSAHFFLGKGVSLQTTASVSGVNVFYHGGPVMHTSITYAIFWLPSGSSFEPSGSDSSYESSITQFFNDVGGTSFYNILSQYPDSTNGTPLDVSLLGGSYVDTTNYPAAGTQTHPLNDSDIETEVVRAMSANGWAPAPNKIFFVFTGSGIESCFNTSFPNSNCTFNAYCAYHSNFLKGSQQVVYANMADFGGPSNPRCVPNYTPPNGDSYADPEINIISHELSEAVSDPLVSPWPGTGWNDGSSEIGDRCAWNFGSNVNPDGSNVVLNGHKYLLQQEWSNYGGTCVLSYGTPYSFSIAPSLGSNPIPSTYHYRINYKSLGSSWFTTTAYTNGTLTISVDLNKTVTISNIFPSTSQTEKWCFDRSCSNVSINSGPGIETTCYYYDLLAQEISVPIIGQATPIVVVNSTTAPIIVGTTDSPQTVTNSTTQMSQTIWALRGTKVSLASQVSGATGERWVTGLVTLTINHVSALPKPIVYYHQYFTTFGFEAIGGPTSYPPTITYSDAGATVVTVPKSSVWADVGPYRYQDQISGPTLGERWSTPSPNGTISSPDGQVSATYYHQYDIMADYLISGGGAPTAPSLTVTIYGLSNPISLSAQPTSLWVDAGSAYSVKDSLGGTTGERWWTSGITSGTASGPMVISLTYSHQYSLMVNGAFGGGYGRRWYDSGSTSFAISPGVSATSSTNRVRISSYSIDGGPQTAITPTVGTVSVRLLMDSPHTIQFATTVQHLFVYALENGSINSTSPSPTGDSWYDNGTSVSVVLNRVWDTSQDQTRRSLVSYTIDSLVTQVSRTSAGLVAIPPILMSMGHILTESSATQYHITVQGATLSGSQTGDEWFDSGSQFTVQGTSSNSYDASLPYHLFAVSSGFQILANTTISSVIWTSSNNTLGFQATRADFTVYIPATLNLFPTRVSDDGTPIVFSYSKTTGLLNFRGSSRFQVVLASSGGGSPSASTTDWGPYLIAAILLTAVIILSAIVLKLRSKGRTVPLVPLGTSYLTNFFRGNHLIREVSLPMLT